MWAWRQLTFCSRAWVKHRFRVDRGSEESPSSDSVVDIAASGLQAYDFARDTNYFTGDCRRAVEVFRRHIPACPRSKIHSKTLS